MDLTDEEKIVISAVRKGKLNLLQVETTIFLYDNAVKFFKEYEDFDFIQSCNGPYSDMVLWILKDMVKLGLISIDGSYKLTDEGIKVCWSEWHIGHVDILNDFVEFVDGLTKDELLSFMYSSFKEYFIYEEEKKELKKTFIECALSMYRTGKISEDKAVEISGVGYMKFKGMSGNDNI